MRYAQRLISFRLKLGIMPSYDLLDLIDGELSGLKFIISQPCYSGIQFLILDKLIQLVICQFFQIHNIWQTDFTLNIAN